MSKICSKSAWKTNINDRARAYGEANDTRPRPNDEEDALSKSRNGKRGSGDERAPIDMSFDFGNQRAGLDDLFPCGCPYVSRHGC